MSKLINPDGTPNRELFREIQQAEELKKFLDQVAIEEAAPGFDFGDVGYKPDPDDPDGDPFPGPFPWPFEVLKNDVLERVQIDEQALQFEAFEEIGG